ncbi:MAG: hypothetical protein P8X96_20765 [Desulfobacteraceae bacterium]|jgi:putative transposase
MDKYAFSGHGVIMGKHQHPWQHSKQVLAWFGKRVNTARRRYRTFVAKGADQGERKDLTGGWLDVNAMRKAKAHMKSDERILGDGDFVAQMLAQANETLERKYALKAGGVDIDVIAERVSQIMGMPVEDLWMEGRYRRLVAARSLLCFWAVRDLSVRMASLARKLGISTAAVSKSVKRGGEIVKKEGYKLI